MWALGLHLCFGNLIRWNINFEVGVVFQVCLSLSGWCWNRAFSPGFVKINLASLWSNSQLGYILIDPMWLSLLRWPLSWDQSRSPFSLVLLKALNTELPQDWHSLGAEKEETWVSYLGVRYQEYQTCRRWLMDANVRYAKPDKTLVR